MKSRRLDDDEILQALREDPKIHAAFDDYCRARRAWGRCRVSGANFLDVIDYRIGVLEAREIGDDEEGLDFRDSECWAV